MLQSGQRGLPFKAIFGKGIPEVTPIHTLISPLYPLGGEGWGRGKARWVIGGKLSIAYNCLDRHAMDPYASNRLAFIWETEDGTIEKWTYLDLYKAANQCANGLKSLGVRKGAAVGFYMPMIPELIVAFWACMKLGAPLIPIFSGFGAKPLAVRLADAKAKVLLTADVTFYKARPIFLKATCDEAAKQVPHLKHILVVKRQTDVQTPWEKARDIWWHELVLGQSAHFKAALLDAEDLAMILYSSGTTGKPKGTLHRVAGVFAQVVKELGFHFDVKPDSRFYWITNIGWMMGPWEIMGVQNFGGSYLYMRGTPFIPATNGSLIWSRATGSLTWAFLLLTAEA